MIDNDLKQLIKKNCDFKYLIVFQGSLREWGSRRVLGEIRTED